MKKIPALFLFLFFFQASFAQLSLTATKSSYIGNYGLTCRGAGDGWITVSVGSGVPPYTYAWSNSATTYHISGLGANTYTCVVVDSVGTHDTIAVTLTQPPLLTLSLSVTDISCHGLTNGAILSSPGGGTPSYSYAWSNASTSSGQTSLSAGTYTLTVTDANGCTISDSGTVHESSSLSLTLTSPVTSNGFNVSAGHYDGSIDLTVSGGTPNVSAPYYTYQWNTGPYTEDITRLSAGLYKVLVTDNHSCTAEDSTYLTTEDSLSADGVPFTTRGNWMNPNDDWLGTRNQSALIVKTYNIERMRIDTMGNIGIGIDTPRVKLDVNGEVRIVGKIKSDSLSFAPDSLDYTPDSAQYYRLVGTNSEGQLTSFRFPIHGGPIGPVNPLLECGAFAAAPTSMVPYWKSDAAHGTLFTYCPQTKVGIGTDQPEEFLDVRGKGLFSDAVGIGTTSPASGYMLDVIGKIRTRELMVCLSGCDFVFEKDYKLTSLKDLENYINANHHLPQIASAKEMEADVVSIGDLQSKLLQKVEELTLYVIEQNKKIEELQKEIKEKK